MRPFVGILTVDDHPVFRGVARQVIEATPGFRQLGEAASGEEAVRLAAALAPDLVLLDVRMRGIDGPEAARRIHAARPETTIVLLSSEDYEGARRMGDCAAAAFLRKDAFGPDALRALWAEHGSCSS